LGKVHGKKSGRMADRSQRGEAAGAAAVLIKNIFGVTYDGKRRRS